MVDVTFKPNISKRPQTAVGGGFAAEHMTWEERMAF